MGELGEDEEAMSGGEWSVEVLGSVRHTEYLTS